MKARRGIAMLVAIWLVVAIAAVVLQFSLVAHERRTLGLGASDRGRQRAAAAGALATLQAQMDYDLRNRATASGNASVAALRSADPWLGVDSLYSGTWYVDSTPVEVSAIDLGTKLNINTMQEVQMQILFSFVLGDSRMATALAQSILDWRDVDDEPRSAGAEIDDYIRSSMLTLPSNAPFREVDDLINVAYMSPEILDELRPYITTHGTASRVNINSAPEAVLRALPGMTDEILVQILAGRSQGRRIQSLAQVMASTNARRIQVTTGGRGGGGQVQVSGVESALTNATTVDTQNVELTFFVKDTMNIQPTRLIAIITRGGGTTATIQWQQW